MKNEQESTEFQMNEICFPSLLFFWFGESCNLHRSSFVAFPFLLLIVCLFHQCISFSNIRFWVGIDMKMLITKKNHSYIITGWLVNVERWWLIFVVMVEEVKSISTEVRFTLQLTGFSVGSKRWHHGSKMKQLTNDYKMKMISHWNSFWRTASCIIA